MRFYMIQPENMTTYTRKQHEKGRKGKEKVSHEEKTDTHRSTDITGSSGACTFDSKHSEIQSGYNSLRDRVFDMLRNGISIADILKEIDDDKRCEEPQKKKILSEIHSV